MGEKLSSLRVSGTVMTRTTGATMALGYGTALAISRDTTGNEKRREHKITK